MIRTFGGLMRAMYRAGSMAMPSPRHSAWRVACRLGSVNLPGEPATDRLMLGGLACADVMRNLYGAGSSPDGFDSISGDRSAGPSFSNNPFKSQNS